MLKTCTKCFKEQPIEAFHVQSDKPDGLACQCRSCRKEVAAKRFIVNREKILAKNTEYRLANPEKEALRHQKYQHDNPEKGIKNNRIYRARHPDRAYAAVRKCNAAHSERYIGGLLAQYRERADNKGITFTITELEFRKMFSQDCAYCGDPPTQDGCGVVRNGIDRVDNALGYTKENTVPCCAMCNYLKKDYALSDFYVKIEKLHLRSPLNPLNVKNAG